MRNNYYCTDPHGYGRETKYIQCVNNIQHTDQTKLSSMSLAKLYRFGSFSVIGRCLANGKHIVVNVEIVRRIGSTEMAADDDLVVSDLHVKGLQCSTDSA